MSSHEPLLRYPATLVRRASPLCVSLRRLYPLSLISRDTGSPRFLSH